MTRLQLKTEGDRHVVVTRRFNATPEMVYRAHTEPDLIHPGDGVAARHALARFIGSRADPVSARGVRRPDR